MAKKKKCGPFSLLYVIDGEVYLDGPYSSMAALVNDVNSRQDDFAEADWVDVITPTHKRYELVKEDDDEGSKYGFPSDLEY